MCLASHLAFKHGDGSKPFVGGESGGGLARTYSILDEQFWGGDVLGVLKDEPVSSFPARGLSFQSSCHLVDRAIRLFGSKGCLGQFAGPSPGRANSHRPSII